jgi:hypothetical protein
MTGHDGEERFELGLSAMIAGLEALSAAETNTRQPERKER